MHCSSCDSHELFAFISQPLKESFGHRILGDQSNLVKRLKTQVQGLIRYHKENVSEATQSGDETAKTFHQKTAE